ncbi:urea amidolyase associated protein UAAP1 [Pseudonocardia sp. MH-G8]|uniref:urea amidolyase associated protein UAAP1 n=1 Tax=Pseudonocardia sp. MH-G8 TaxID=1854588 RepID=UPI000BA00AD3|nr:urea amidolyase associated protein UAAP1 [Pseudonocardia sp. MH-G8]OZM81797.1 urea carboxylase [Pseudonocardia sp. MH-G8]
MTTATTAGARAHARSQHRRLVTAMRHVPATAAPALPADVPADAVTWAETVAFGRYTTMALARGTRLRLADPDGDACVSLLLHRVGAPHERLNVADTVKVPWQAYLGEGHPLLSDAGRLLATIVADTSGHHDALTGTTTPAGNAERYGAGAAHSASPAGRELLTLGVLKHGMGPRDVPPSISFFQGVRVEPDGTTRFLGSAGAGTAVDLLLQTDLIVTLANTAHPLDPRPEFTGAPVEVVAWSDPADLAALAAGSLGPEHRRALENTEHDLTARSPR